MNLEISPQSADLLKRATDFIDEQVLPVEDEYLREVDVGNRWTLTDRQTEIIETLKSDARAQGLWNFFLPEEGPGISAVDYAYIAEQTGRTVLAAEAFNCSAPDTGNMEVLHRYGSEAQKEEWLKPLLAGTIRSAFAMTEPGVASSDATNIAMSAVEDGDDWVINGEKFYISGAGDPRCKILICMVRTDPEAGRHQQHSQILVPKDTPGLTIVRPMHVFSMDDAPHGHMHLRFENVRVPRENMILGRGRGFEISQGRLGPGRIHHCMRAIGASEKALRLMCERSMSRSAFGKPLAQLGGNFDIIANARMDIDMVRLLTLQTAYVIDQHGVKAARTMISKIKVVAPNVALRVIDEAIQMHGATGVSQDTPLAHMYMQMRTLRLADGPDAVHRRLVAREELGRYAPR
ncbi:MAG: acyl-CoA dehydrogenase family protein [Gammaproteobacteria bacterium]